MTGLNISKWIQPSLHPGVHRKTDFTTSYRAPVLATVHDSSLRTLLNRDVRFRRLQNALASTGLMLSRVAIRGENGRTPFQVLSI